MNASTATRIPPGALALSQRATDALTRQLSRLLRAPVAEAASGCLVVAPLRDGHVRKTVNGRRVSARRAVFEHVYGPLEEGEVVASTCGLASCVHPVHLRVVTRSELMASLPHNVAKRARAYCVHGHALEGANVVLRRDGSRACRECKRAAARARHHAKKAAQA